VPKAETTEVEGRFGSIEPIQRAQQKQEQVRSQLLGEIAVGRLRPGDALPSEKRLAELLRISRHTIRRALGELERDGVVERLHGKGTFVVDRPSESIATRTPSFAVIVNEVSTGYYPSLLSAFEQAAKVVGRPTVICNSNNDIAQQGDHLLHLLNNRVSGLALNACSSTPTPAYQVQVMQDAGIPVVLLHRPVADVKAPVLRVPEHQLGYRAGRLILENGHRRAAFLSGPHGATVSMTELGFRNALAEAGCTLPSEFVHYSRLKTFSTEEGLLLTEEQIKTWLKGMFSLPEPPTALFTTFDSLGELIYLVAGEIGLQVPSDLSIVSYGGVRREGAVISRLTAITIDESEEARLAVQLLVEMCDGRRSICSEEEIMLSLSISPGQTLTPPGIRRVE
jgi:GntR family transcriptional regulator, arabinose operon transcriptional repressor